MRYWITTRSGNVHGKEQFTDGASGAAAAHPGGRIHAGWTRSPTAATTTPEQWPEEIWAQDVELMRVAGVNLVSVGIFSWALIEPAEGRYTFDWLDRALDLLHGAGIRVDLATPTAAPPPWFAHRHPGARLVDRAGHVLGQGGRQSFCPSSPDYARGVRRASPSSSAARYGEHPAVALWHVHNEFAGVNAHCYCDTCAAALPRLAAGPARRPGDAQRRVGHHVLGPALRRLGARSSRRGVAPDRRQPGPAAGLPALLLRHAPGQLPARARRPAPALPRRADHHQLHDRQLQVAGLLEVGRRGRHRLQRPLPGRRARRPAHRAGACARTSPAAWPAARRGC